MRIAADAAALRGSGAASRQGSGTLPGGVGIRQTSSGFADRLHKSLSSLSKHLDVRALLRRFVALLQRFLHREPTRVAQSPLLQPDRPLSFRPGAGLQSEPPKAHPLQLPTNAPRIPEAEVTDRAERQLEVSGAPLVHRIEAERLSDSTVRLVEKELPGAQGRWPALLAELAQVPAEARFLLVKNIREISSPDADPSASPRAFEADAKRLSALMRCSQAARLDRTLQLVHALEQLVHELELWALGAPQAHIDWLDEIKADVTELLLAFLDDETLLADFLDDDNLLAFLDEDKKLAPLLEQVRTDILVFNALTVVDPVLTEEAINAVANAVAEAGFAFLDAIDPQALPPAPPADSDSPEPSGTHLLVRSWTRS